MKNEVILARVAWSKVTIYFLTPIILLAAGYATLSDRPLNQVFSIDNWMTPTPWTPFPVFGIFCIIVIVGLSLHKIATLWKSDDKYLWIDSDDNLIYSNKIISRLSELDASGIELISVRLSQYLEIRRLDGSKITAPMIFGRFQRDALVANLEHRIKAS